MKSLLVKSGLILLIFGSFVPIAFSEPCNKPLRSKSFYDPYRPYDREYEIKFDSLFRCNTSTAQEINEFMHLALTDEKIDPLLVKRYLDQLSSRDPYHGVFFIGVFPSASEEAKVEARKDKVKNNFANPIALESVLLQEEDVEIFLNRLIQESKLTPKTNYEHASENFEAMRRRWANEEKNRSRTFEGVQWDAESIEKVELDARKLLLPKEVADAIWEIEVCHYGGPFGEISNVEDCSNAYEKYANTLKKYKEDPQIMKNAARTRDLGIRNMIYLKDYFR